MKKIIFSVFFLVFISFFNEAVSQNDGMFKQKRERKRLWRKHKTSDDAYNPYLKKKAKNKPSAIINKRNKKDERREKRNYKKQIKKHKSPDPK